MVHGFGRGVIKTRAEIRYEYKGYTLVQYKDHMFGDTFCNAEIFNPDGKFEMHATMTKIMQTEDEMKDYIENHIEFMKLREEGKL